MISCSQKTTEVMEDKPAMTEAKEMIDPEAFRATAPEAAPAPTINIGQAESFDLKNGLKVIVVENHKIPQVSFQVRLINDPILEGNKVGLTDIASQLLRRGTTSMTKAELDEAVDFIGGSLSSSSSGVFASALTKHQDKILTLMTDVLFNPSFPEEELGKIKTQTLSGLESLKTSPDAIASNVRARVLYGADHPYGEIQAPEHVEATTVDDLKNYYANFYVPANAYLIMVGDIDKAGAMTLANKYFGKWTGSMPKPSSQRALLEKDNRQVSFAHKEGAVQSVINLSTSFNLKPGAPDVIPSSVMNSILGGGFSSRLSQNLREDKAYTYGSYSSFSSDPVTASFTASASTRSEVTDSSIVQMMYEIERLRNEPVGEEELTSIKNYMTGGFARSLESPQTIARFAYSIARFNLPSDYYQTYLQKLNSVTAADVQAMAQKYLVPEKMSVVVIGNKDDVADKLKVFDTDGDVTFYDAFANEIKVSDTPVPTNLTGQQVIEQYIDAIGGADNIAAIKTLYMKSTTNAFGMDIVAETYQKDGMKSAMKMASGPMVLQEQKYNGSQFVVAAAGQQPQVYTDGPELEDAKNSALIVEQTGYLADGIALELKSVEDIEGTQAYRVVVTKGEDATVTEYYSVSDHLLIRSSASQDTPQGAVTITTDYSVYEEVNGVLMPHVVKITGMLPGGASLEMKVEEASANIDIDDTVFEQ